MAKKEEPLVPTPGTLSAAGGRQFVGHQRVIARRVRPILPGRVVRGAGEAVVPEDPADGYAHGRPRFGIAQLALARRCP